MLKQIISKSLIILSMIFIFLSICIVSSIDVLKGNISIPEAFIKNKSTIDIIEECNIRELPHELTVLFYLSLILIFASSVISFSKTNKTKKIITIILSIALNLYGFVTNNYILFLMCFNVFLLLYVLFDSYNKNNKLCICNRAISVFLFLFNIIGLLNHFFLDFDATNYKESVNKLISISTINLVSLILWAFPYIILLILNIMNIYKED